MNYRIKRLFDFFLSLGAIFLFAPAFIIIYILIKIEDPSSGAIYAQERIGLGGKPFRLFKFRSMRPNAELMDAPQLYAGDNDPRLTKIGRFIRIHHLDEFPQLWNILRGEMSFVGPRPEREYYIKQIIEHNPDYTKLYAIRPGIFSYATLYNGYTDTMEKMLRRLDYDLEYLEHASFWTDIKIIYLTSISIVSGKKF